LSCSMQCITLFFLEEHVLHCFFWHSFEMSFRELICSQAVVTRPFQTNDTKVVYHCTEFVGDSDTKPSMRTSIALMIT
jgi:hypothetical protein